MQLQQIWNMDIDKNQPQKRRKKNSAVTLFKKLSFKTITMNEIYTKRSFKKLLKFIHKKIS